MTNIKTTAGLVAVAALALPGAAATAKDPPPGQQTAKQRHERNAARTKQHPTPAAPTTRCDRKVGFKASGTGLDASKLTLTDGKAGGTLTFDVLRANRHARRFLQITKLPANDETLTLSDDALKLRLVGLKALSDVQPTDRVQIVGRVTKPRRSCATATTQQSLDVRKITIIHRTPETKTKTETARASARATAPGQMCRTESRKKTNHGKGKSPFAACVIGAKRAQTQAAQSPKKHTAPGQFCKDQSRKKSATDKKSPFAACVTGAAKAQKEQQGS